MDSTVVAVFENPQRADDAKRELIARRICQEKDVSVVVQQSATTPHGPIEWVKSHLGSPPPPTKRGVLTVYVGPDRLGEIEQLVRGHEPSDVKIHAAAPVEPPVPAQ